MADDFTKTAKTVASDAAKTAKAAAKAASGNYVGAAVEAVQTSWGKAIVLIAAGLVLMTLLSVAAVPMLIFGSVDKFFAERGDAIVSESEEAGDEDYLVSADAASYVPDGTYSDETKEAYHRSLWDRVKSIFGYSSGEEDYFDVYSGESYQYRVVGYDDPEAEETDEPVDYARKTTVDYVDTTLKRFERRRTQYRAMFNVIAAQLRTNPDMLTAWAGSGCDEMQIVEHFDVQELTRRDVIPLLCAYNVQRGNNGTFDLTPTSYLSWLGYYWSINSSDTGYVCSDFVGGYSYSTTQWNGDCLPQYLYEEMHTREEVQRIANPDFSERELDDIFDTIRDDYADYGFSLLSSVYFVDKATGITAPSHVVTETRVDSFGDEYTYKILVVDLTMTSTYLQIKDRSNNGKDIVSLMGFWTGDLNDAQYVPPEADPVYYARTWTSPVTGETFERLYGYQVDYLASDAASGSTSNMVYSTRKYVGEEYNLNATAQDPTGGSSATGSSCYINLDDIDFNVEGATVAQTEFIRSMIELALEQVGNGNYPYYCDHGDSSMQWCGMFVMWVLKNSGFYALEEKFEMGTYNSRCAHGPWAVMGGQLDYQYKVIGEGSNEYGSTILYENSVVSGGGEYIPQVGDLIFFTKDGSGISHIGIVVSYDINTNDLYTVEGNTWTPEKESCVSVKNRTNGYRYGSVNGYSIKGFAHPNYPES